MSTKWKEYELGELLEYEQPTAYIVQSTKYDEKYFIPVLTAGKSFILGHTNETEGVFDRLPVIIFDDFTTATQYVNFKFKVKSSAMKILHVNTKLVLPKFIFYRMQVIEFDHSTHKRYWIQEYSHIKVSIPDSLDVQQQIVSHIEELFSDLDDGVATLEKTKKELELYRQTVLKTFFDSLGKEKLKTIGEGCESIVDCPHSTPKWTKNGRLCLRTTNFKRGHLDLSEKNYVSDQTYTERTKRLEPKPGDVLYSREGAILGIACIIPENVFPCLGQRMMLLRVNDMLNNKYLEYYLNSPRVTRYVASITGGSASPHINVGDIKQFKIPFPNITTQNKIVSQIEERLSVCDEISASIETALQRSQSLRQSILKKAFEGELVHE